MHRTQGKLLKLISKKNLGTLSLRGISELLGKNKKTGELDTAQTVKHHLLQLAKRGLIRINRPCQVIQRVKPGKQPSGLIAIPILGTCGGGEVIPAFLKKSHG